MLACGREEGLQRALARDVLALCTPLALWRTAEEDPGCLAERVLRREYVDAVERLLAKRRIPPRRLRERAADAATPCE